MPRYSKNVKKNSCDDAAKLVSVSNIHTYFMWSTRVDLEGGMVIMQGFEQVAC